MPDEQEYFDEVVARTDLGQPTVIQSGLRRSPTIGKLAAALAKAQGEYGVAMKDTSNPFFKSKYADLASIINATRKALSDNGIAVCQPCQTDNAAKMVVVTTLLVHSSGEWMEADLKIPTAKWDAQTLGSASTYGRRYGLQGFLTVAGEDDDGNAATAASNEQAREQHLDKLSPKLVSQERIAPPFVKAFFEACDKSGHGEAQIKAFLGEQGYVQVEELTKSDWPAAIKWATSPSVVPQELAKPLKASVAQVKKTSPVESPANADREKAMRTLYASAKDKQISELDFKTWAYETFSVDSLTKLDVRQLNAVIDWVKEA
jgi:hypothetical protein